VKNLTWQNPEQLFVAQELIKIVKLKCCGIWAHEIYTFSHNEEALHFIDVCDADDVACSRQ
jgi:hypothetical protein